MKYMNYECKKCYNVCVSAEGVIRVYDTRTLAATEVVRAPGPLAALDLHPLCNLLAWYVASGVFTSSVPHISYKSTL